MFFFTKITFIFSYLLTTLSPIKPREKINKIKFWIKTKILKIKKIIEEKKVCGLEIIFLAEILDCPCYFTLYFFIFLFWKKNDHKSFNKKKEFEYIYIKKYHHNCVLGSTACGVTVRTSCLLVYFYNYNYYYFPWIAGKLSPLAPSVEITCRVNGQHFRLPWWNIIRT